MKTFKYKKVAVNLPENISISRAKSIIDELGGDYCFTVQRVIDLISSKYLPNVQEEEI